MKNRKYMLCRYPDNGFGSKSGSFYLLDVFGHRYDIEDEYDKTLDEMNKVVTLNDSVGGTYCESTIDKLIERIETDTDSKIERW